MKIVELFQDDVDHHGFGCKCGDCNENGTSYGVTLFDITSFGITHRFQLTEDMTDEMFELEPIEVIYGPSEDTAEHRARHYVGIRGWNLLEETVSKEILVGALEMLVGDDGYLTDHDICECDNTHVQNHTMCRICWARASLQAVYSQQEKKRIKLRMKMFKAFTESWLDERVSLAYSFFKRDGYTKEELQGICEKSILNDMWQHTPMYEFGEDPETYRPLVTEKVRKVLEDYGSN